MNSAGQNDDTRYEDADDKVAPASPATLRWLGMIAVALLLGWGIRNWTAQNATQPLPLGPIVEDRAEAHNAEPAATQTESVPQTAVTAPVPRAPVPAPTVVVHVTGHVNSPGLYVLPANSRVSDAVARAGGVSLDGDGNALNLAAWLTDGQRIEVPARNQAAANPPPASAVPAPAAPTLSPGKRSPEDLRSNPLDLNLATAQDFASLPGVGPTLAARIVTYRRQNNGFRNVAELEQVPGFGDKRLADLRPLLFVR